MNEEKWKKSWEIELGLRVILEPRVIAFRIIAIAYGLVFKAFKNGTIRMRSLLEGLYYYQMFIKTCNRDVFIVSM